VRLLTAMADVAAKHGVARVTVAHVVARSGVSRRTFYELFDDREACFLAAFDHGLAQAASAVVPGYERQGKWHDQVRAGLAALLAFFDARPEWGRVLVLGALGAGPTALRRRTQILATLIEIVDRGRTEASANTRKTMPPLIAEGVVGAVLSVVHARMLVQKPEPLSGLLGSLMGMVVLPYLGANAALKELTRPNPEPGLAVPRRGHRDPLDGLDMRLTYRTVRVLGAIAASPGASNRQVAGAAGISDQGQSSKLLRRLSNLGLIHNAASDQAKGEPNAWSLTPRGQQVEQALR
jgi:AcrR family transcriptional regulator